MPAVLLHLAPPIHVIDVYFNVKPFSYPHLAVRDVVQTRTKGLGTRFLSLEIRRNVVKNEKIL